MQGSLQSILVGFPLYKAEPFWWHRTMVYENDKGKITDASVKIMSEKKWNLFDFFMIRIEIVLVCSYNRKRVPKPQSFLLPDGLEAF